QTGHWIPAVTCALAMEAARFMPLRWEFTDKRLNGVGDFCALVTIILAVSLYVTLGNPRAITQLFSWLPLAYLPIALTQAYGNQNNLELGVLFRNMRGTGNREPIRLNFAYPYFALWIIAASTANRRDWTFEAGLVTLTAWALWQARPRSQSLARWLLLVP